MTSGGTGNTARATLYLVRHGRTQLNASGRVRGRGADAPLDDVGRQQAAALGRHFADVPLDHIQASPLQRTLATAEAVARPHDLAVEVDDDLLDRDWGPWTGQLESEVLGRYGTLDRAPGVEPTAAFTRRVVERVVALGRVERAAPLMLVTHDAIIKVVLAALAQNLGDDPNDVSLHTGCWNQLDRQGDTWTATVVDAVPDRG